MMTLAAKKAASTVDPKRLSSITQQITQHLASVRGAVLNEDERAAAVKDAKDIQKEVGATGVNAREQVMLDLARLSLHGKWTAEEIKEAGTAAAKGNQLKADKAISTFMGEAMLAMDPNVCDTFSEVLTLRDMAWAEETAALEVDKAAPAPIRKAFARKYHFLMGVLRAAKQGRFFPTVAEMVGFAIANDPDHNPEAVFKKLKKMITDLTKFHTDFPERDIGAAITQLQNITAEQLTAARNEKLGIVPEQDEEEEQDETEMMTGAVELDDMLSANVGGKQMELLQQPA